MMKDAKAFRKKKIVYRFFCRAGGPSAGKGSG
jgi:hypothetical protein